MPRPAANPAAADAKRSRSPAGDSREARINEIIETTRAKRPRFKDERITMAHGAGGKATQTLIEGLFAPAFGSEQLQELGDARSVSAEPSPGTPGREAEDTAGGGSAAGICLTTDTFVVKPLASPAGRSASSPSTGPSTTSRSPGRGRLR